MRSHFRLIFALAFAVAYSPAQADHKRPGIFHDVGAPPAAEDPSHGNTSTLLMVRRCEDFLRTAQINRAGHIRRYRHNHNAGFCIGWINSAMVFLNLRTESGGEMLGVCLPEGVHSNAVIETFLDYVKGHPDDRKYNPSFLIYWAMLEKYPCKR
jgi:hypothetical protein